MKHKGPPMPWRYRLVAIFLFVVLMGWVWYIVR